MLAKVVPKPLVLLFDLLELSLDNRDLRRGMDFEILENAVANVQLWIDHCGPKDHLVKLHARYRDILADLNEFKDSCLTWKQRLFVHEWNSTPIRTRSEELARSRGMKRREQKPSFTPAVLLLPLPKRPLGK